MKRIGVLWRKAPWVLGLMVLASAGAGTALADGLVPGGVTSALPTLSTPVTSATLPVSTTISTPTTSTPAATTTVSTPVTPLTIAAPPAPPPTVTGQIVPAPAPVPQAPLPAVSVSAPAVPTSTTAAATVTVGGTSVSVQASASPVGSSAQAGASVTVATGTRTTSASVALTGSAPTVTVAAGGGPEQPSVRVASDTRPEASRGAASSVLLGAASQAGATAEATLSYGPFGSPGEDDPILASLLGLTRSAGAAGAEGVPILTEGAAGPAPATGRSSPGLGGSAGAIIGGLAALSALAGLGLVAAARSSGFLGVCASLLRFPFPHFRLLPCPGRATMVTSAAPAHGIGHPPPARPSTAKPSFERPLLGSLPWPRGAPGAGLSVSHPWQLLRTVILAMLAAANVLLLALRRQVGRSQNR